MYNKGGVSGKNISDWRHSLTPNRWKSTLLLAIPQIEHLDHEIIGRVVLFIVLHHKVLGAE